MDVILIFLKIRNDFMLCLIIFNRYPNIYCDLAVPWKTNYPNKISYGFPKGRFEIQL